MCGNKNLQNQAVNQTALLKVEFIGNTFREKEGNATHTGYYRDFVC